MPPTTGKKEDIILLFKDLETEPDDWRGMKVIILGNGRIGKTTYVNFLKKMLNQETVCLYELHYLLQVFVFKCSYK